MIEYLIIHQFRLYFHMLSRLRHFEHFFINGIGNIFIQKKYVVYLRYKWRGGGV